MSTSHSSADIERHPDIVALRERYDSIGGTLPAQFAAGSLFVAAGYVAIAPWVVGFRGVSPNLSITDLITGIAVMVLTLGFGASYGRTHGMAWVAPLVGAWVIVAPWAVQNTDRTTGLLLSNIIAGACMVLFGLVLAMLAASRGMGMRMGMGAGMGTGMGTGMGMGARMGMDRRMPPRSEMSRGPEGPVR